MKKKNFTLSGSFSFLFVILGFIFLTQFPVSHLSHKFFHDDTYYYLQTAVNAAEGHGLSFDQITTTNGFHFLWMWLLISIFKIFTTMGFALTDRKSVV